MIYETVLGEAVCKFADAGGSVIKGKINLKNKKCWVSDSSLSTETTDTGTRIGPPIGITNAIIDFNTNLY
jgi:hypothetical protein